MDAPLEYNPTGTPRACMILMHGLGADGNDLFPLAAEIGGGEFRVVCPHAPVRAVTLNGGQQMRAWYDIVGLDLADRQDRNGATESAVLIEQLLAAEYANGFRSENIFLAGFSQGAAMALHVGLHCPQRLAGIIALSGYLLFAETLADSISAANRQTPIFQAHGSLDPVVLPQWGHMTRDWLQEQGYPLEYHEYMMPHAIVPEEINAINRWCEKQC
ncbi:MAG: carboxylesterase [Proteobacteria bacterium]|nr:carboxylesterase [Pseudomonadota bacterium]